MTNYHNCQRQINCFYYQEIDKENYQTIGSCVAGPAAASAKATKSSCAAAASSSAMTASNRLLFDRFASSEKLLDGFRQHQLEKQMKPLPDSVAPDRHSQWLKTVSNSGVKDSFNFNI